MLQLPINIIYDNYSHGRKIVLYHICLYCYFINGGSQAWCLGRRLRLQKPLPIVTVSYEGWRSQQVVVLGARNQISNVFSIF
jgi:hypothetical protein